MIALLRLIPAWVFALIAAIGIVTALWFRLDGVTAERDKAQQALIESETRVESIRQTLQLQRDLYVQVTAVNDGYDRQVQQLQAEKDQLDRDLADGKRGLSVKATCVPRAATTPGTVTSTDDSTPRLTDSAQRDYLDLRAGIIRQASQITGLQNYITNVCLKGQVQ